MGMNRTEQVERILKILGLKCDNKNSPLYSELWRFVDNLILDSYNDGWKEASMKIRKERTKE